MAAFHSLRLVLVILFTVLATKNDTSVSAQDRESKPAEIDLTKFAQLPVRFNGRVTTYEVVAKNYLRRFGGRDVCYDAAGKEQPAVRWLLDVMSAHPDRGEWRVFKIENPELLKLLKLEPHADVKPTRFYYAFDNLLDQEKLLADRYRKVQEMAEQSHTDRDLSRLYDELVSYQGLEMSFDPPASVDPDNGRRILSTLDYLTHRPLPLFLPSESEASWNLYYEAFVRNAIANEDRKNEHLERFQKMIEAHAKRDARAFAAGVEAYSKSFAKIPATKSPFDFTLPEGCLDTGVESSSDCLYFGDADAMGRQIVEISLAPDGESRLIVNHFQNQTVSLVDLINSWRISLGLAPLPEADLKKSLKPTQVAGRDAVLVDVQTPREVELPVRTRYLTTVLTEGDQTFVFSWFGTPDTIDRHLETHRKLMQSIRMGTREELAQWFPAQCERPPFSRRRAIAAVVPDGGQVWILFSLLNEDEVSDHRGKILNIFDSLNFAKGSNGRSKPSWDLPEGWQRIGGIGLATLALGSKPTSPVMTIIPLGEAREETVNTLVDFWASKIHAGKLSGKQRSESIKEITIGGRKAFLIEIQGQLPETKTPSGLAFKAPGHWKAQQPGGFREAGFDITSNGEEASLSVTALPTGAGLALNINRWRQQLELPPAEEQAALKDTKPIAIGKAKGTLVDLHNPQTAKRILAAVVKQGEKDWYFKILGDADIIEAERKNFEAFLKSVKFPETEK